MASNPRMTPSNKGVNASQRSKDMLTQRRQTPGGGLRGAPESNNASLRAKQLTASHKQERAQGGRGAGPVPAEGNAADRDLNRRIQTRQARAQQGM